MSVLIVDYGMGNLASARRAFEKCGVRTLVSNDPASVATASRVVIPGVGAFAQAMRRLNERGWVDALREDAVEKGVPVLGVCLGMQLLAEVGTEGGDTPGLGLISGRVEKLSPETAAERIPHVGWNEVYPTNSCSLFAGIRSGSDFYFVHSYHLVVDDENLVAARSPYCGGFVSAVKFGRVFGVQFHPEKSAHRECGSYRTSWRSDVLKTRVIPTLLMRDVGLVKGVAFDSWRRVGAPLQAINVFNARGVDELILLDIGATPEGQDPDYELVSTLAEECFVPLTVGGGVRSVEAVTRLLAPVPTRYL